MFVIDTNDTADYTFVQGDLKGRGDIFEEFFYGMQSLNVTKVKPEAHQYHVGDAIPVTGKMYAYPQDFDCLILRDHIAVEVRQGTIQFIQSLNDYAYTGMPLINGRGFAIKVSSPAAFAQFMENTIRAVKIRMPNCLKRGWILIHIVQFNSKMTFKRIE